MLTNTKKAYAMGTVIAFTALSIGYILYKVIKKRSTRIQSGINIEGNSYSYLSMRNVFLIIYHIIGLSQIKDRELINNLFNLAA
jgi:hypothetical protein